MRNRTVLSLVLAVVILATSLPATSNGSDAPLTLVVASPSGRVLTNQPVAKVKGRTNGETVVIAVNESTRTALVTSSGAFGLLVRLKSGANTIRVTARRGDERAVTTRRVVLDRRPPRILSFAVRAAHYSTRTSRRTRKRIARYRLSETARLTVILRTRRGKRMRTILRTVVPARRLLIRWNGRSRKGRLLKSGAYRLTLVARDRAGNITRRSKRIRIRIHSNTGNSRRIRRLVRTAMRFRGVRYVWGGMSPRGFDCSGFVGYVYRLNGISLPRTSREMAHAGRRVSIRRLKPGDLLLFNTNGSGISHVGMYLSRGRFINSSSGSGGVVIASIRRGYYRARFVMARRVIR